MLIPTTKNFLVVRGSIQYVHILHILTRISRWFVGRNKRQSIAPHGWCNALSLIAPYDLHIQVEKVTPHDYRRK